MGMVRYPSLSDQRSAVLLVHLLSRSTTASRKKVEGCRIEYWYPVSHRVLLPRTKVDADANADEGYDCDVVHSLNCRKQRVHSLPCHRGGRYSLYNNAPAVDLKRECCEPVF